ncbi:hypothetical protein JOF56_011332 [Kibdelosporangium banguiense]|uniref:Uncharacterized protein n=1 Tax=Kibdelosporangium banguiense TaxID=1365924 RepID=A0ABS4U2Q5_9PSEU|nr:hypothetical protein [Kibdelosporangium banguiense]
MCTRITFATPTIALFTLTWPHLRVSLSRRRIGAAPVRVPSC